MVEDGKQHSERATPDFALSIVIPVYNEASSIPELIGALEETSDRRRPRDNIGR
jgi:hypothetical protein